MTDSHTLLAEYAETGSESAFRELVTRYFGLVYAAALRLVDGDAHLAEDVAQTVFADLARNAHGLSPQVTLGGWLHQRTFNVAAPLMRARRRREAREREAALMSTLQDGPEEDLAQIAPILDEAITHLHTEDRTAILLRFFERRDFRAIGAALGSSEDAARMRVSRALEKLHLLLEQRGATISAAALATALAGEAVTAAPAGLGATVAGTVLAMPFAAGMTSTLFNVTLMAKLQAGIASAAVVAGIAVSLVVHNQSNARLREQDAALRRQSDQLAQLTAENERLSNLVAAAESAKAQVAELASLRAEAEVLRQKTNQLAILRQARRPAPVAQTKTPEEIREEQFAKMNVGKQWMVGLLMYAGDHQGQYPTNFEQVLPYRPGQGGNSNLIERFDLVYRGSVDMKSPADVVVLKEREPWTDADGNLRKVYAFADGHVQVVGMPSRWTVAGKEVSYDTFEDYEKDHIIPPSTP